MTRRQYCSPDAAVRDARGAGAGDGDGDGDGVEDRGGAGVGVEDHRGGRGVGRGGRAAWRLCHSADPTRGADVGAAAAGGGGAAAATAGVPLPRRRDGDGRGSAHAPARTTTKSPSAICFMIRLRSPDEDGAAARAFRGALSLSGFPLRRIVSGARVRSRHRRAQESTAAARPSCARSAPVRPARRPRAPPLPPVQGAGTHARAQGSARATVPVRARCRPARATPIPAHGAPGAVRAGAGAAAGPDDVDGRPGNGGAGAPTSRNAARPCAPSARRGAHPPVFGRHDCPHSPVVRQGFVPFRGRCAAPSNRAAGGPLRRAEAGARPGRRGRWRRRGRGRQTGRRAPGPPCHHPRHCIGCACQILSVTPSKKPGRRGPQPGRRRRPTGRARQRRRRGAYQPQRGPTLRAKRPPRHPPRLVHFAGFRMQSHDSLLRIRPPCHHPRHCIGCACQILSVTPSKKPGRRGPQPGRRRRPTGRARQRRRRGAYQPQRGPTLRAKRPPWRARRSTPAACHARSTTPPPPPSDSHWRRGIRRAHIPMPTLHTLAHAPPAAQGRPRRRFRRRRPNRNRRIVAIAAAFPVRVDTLPPSPPRFLVTCRP